MGRVVVLLLLSIQTALLSAGDWPQILGPHRDGIAGESFTLAWPKKGPVEVWSAEVGTGFSGPAVRDGKVYQLHRVDDQLVLQCYNAENGKPLWNAKHACSYRASISYDDGPRCVPTVTESQVITYGPGGQLQAVDLKTGQQQWIVDTHEKYKADAGYFGAGSSPIVVEDRVIVNVGGGRSDAGLVAFALKDGSELWKISSEAASYSSPVVTQLGKQTIVLAVTRMKCQAFDPATGKTLFEFPFGKRGPTVNAANPVVIENRLFLTASYGIGAVYGKMTTNSFEPEWSSDQVLSSQYTTSVVKDGFLYGVHGRQDLGQAELRCLNPRTQKVIWSNLLPAYGTLILADDKLLITMIDGSLIVAEANPREYKLLKQAKIQQATEGGLALPALSNGHLFVRDAKNLRCVKIGNFN
jgi:outer membrane protein assembly factor BamB